MIVYGSSFGVWIVGYKDPVTWKSYGALVYEPLKDISQWPRWYSLSRK